MDRPCLVWDGDCGFCRRSVQHLRVWLGEPVDFEPYQTAHVRFPAIPVEAFREAVHLVEPDGRVSRGAEAVFRTLAHGGKALPLAAYRRLPGFAALSEWGYRQVASHRPLFSRLLDLLVGDLVGPPQFRLTRFVFLRLLALVYLAAFLSLGSQVHGLIGERGLLPAQDLLLAARQARGDEAFWLLPTLGWLGAGDTALSRPLWGGRGGGPARAPRLCPGAALRRVLGLLPVARPPRAGLPVLPVGRAAPRDRLHRARSSRPGRTSGRGDRGTSRSRRPSSSGCCACCSSS